MGINQSKRKQLIGKRGERFILNLIFIYLLSSKCYQ